MPTITLTATTPSSLSGSSDIFLNQIFTLTFSSQLAAASVSDETFLLVDLVASESVPITVLLVSTDITKVQITPNYRLKENTLYRITVVGSDSYVTQYLKAADGTSLTTSVLLDFTTGDSLYQIDTTVQKEASNLSLEGDLFLPTNVKALGYDFTIEKVRPKNHTHNVPVALNGSNQVIFSFSKDLYTGATVDYTTWADVQQAPLLDEANYLAISGSIKSENPNSYDYTLYDPEITVTGKELRFNFTGNVPNNTNISIQLNSNIKSLDGATYGGSMDYRINTEVYPVVFGVNAVKSELKALQSSIYDDYIGLLLFKNTIMLWEKTGRGFSLGDVPWAAKKYILYSSILNIIEDEDYAKFLVAGTRRQLGDLNVSVDSLVGRLAMKVTSIKKEIDVAINSLFPGWQFKTAVKQGDSIAEEVRLWYDVNGRYTEPAYKYFQADEPSSNTVLNRQAKTTNQW